MGEQGAALQKYNQELVKCIEQIKQKRSELDKDIEREELIKAELEVQLNELNKKLDAINESLFEKTKIRNSYDSTIHETELAFMKILECSQVLLNKVRQESEGLSSL